ncbi:MAG: DEAD/DEAH box helicase, partial [archaeon]|nr:DEAD/DEAH box helicase [archaeon]
DQFAPDLKVGFYYGSSRPSDLNDLTKLINEKDILLTSYGLLRRDIKLISLVNWDIVVLDESQNIKNYKTKQTQASYELKATSKICLTGTPIENHLSELWSMFHFLNPFLLDKRSSFIKRYFIPIERLGNAAASEKLRKTIMPFLLRRLKSDKTIIKDLPEKQEIKLFIDLTERQKKTYAAVVEEGLEKIAMQEEVGKGSALKRKGAILNTIMKLKQVCNHPAQALHENIELKEENISKFISDSAKLKRIVEMLEEIKASGDKILIFTQFRVMGDYLEDIIRDIMNIEPLYLHGGVPQKKRDEMVLNFQNDESNIHPVFILSLKAGGTGLNLTKASTVLHFDRWWNPAVENQATDRAYRIGQKKNVMVYKMISTGTIEEKIDKMIEQKKELADKIIASSNEDWITDLNNDDLRELFRLDEGALGGQ